jgi:hypothetical protein
MLSFFKEENGQKEQNLTEFNDPFNSNCCESINLWIRKPIFSFSEQKIEYKAMIEFKSGNTSGRQTIESEDFSSLLKKVEDFVKSLENK